MCTLLLSGIMLSISHTSIRTIYTKFSLAESYQGINTSNMSTLRQFLAKKTTLPETNKWLGYQFPFGTAYFEALC